jgi:hypothetical protein
MALVTLIATFAYLGQLPNPSFLFRHYDLICHLVLIGMLAFFLDGVLNFRPLFANPPRLEWLRLAPVVILTFAGIEELAQSLSPNRTCNFWDFAADVTGVMLCSHLALRLDRWRRGRELPRR